MILDNADIPYVLVSYIGYRMIQKSFNLISKLHIKFKITKRQEWNAPRNVRKINQVLIWWRRWWLASIWWLHFSRRRPNAYRVDHFGLHEKSSYLKRNKIKRSYVYEMKSLERRGLGGGSEVDWTATMCTCGTTLSATPLSSFRLYTTDADLVFFCFLRSISVKNNVYTLCRHTFFVEYYRFLGRCTRFFFFFGILNGQKIPSCECVSMFSWKDKSIFYECRSQRFTRL